VARRGRPLLKAETIKPKAWEALLEMQRLVSRGLRPNAAAVSIANQHWRDMSKTHTAAVQWLKRNQRKFSPRLRDVMTRTGRGELLEFKRRNPRWTVVSTEFDLNKPQMDRWSVVPVRVNLSKKN
jgi:hypothetical protein